MLQYLKRFKRFLNSLVIAIQFRSINKGINKFETKYKGIEKKA